MTKKLNCILLVDDDDGTNFLHTMVIEDANIVENILVALDGEEALEIIINVENKYPKPDLVFLDINMPRMNGWEFLEELHKIDKQKPLIIVMLTASLNPDDLKRAEAIPDIKYFKNKPLNLKMLEEIVIGL